MSIDRFIKAQENMYDQALSEIREGRKRRHKGIMKILAGFNVADYLIYVLSSIGGDTGNLIMSLEWLVVSIICFLMVIGKYKDKENRA